MTTASQPATADALSPSLVQPLLAHAVAGGAPAVEVFAPVNGAKIVDLP
jgi:succinate-semialdehyde dehydrogenase / glutarate-semialdehyde dehydrogenase